eukprot:jgi/Ulvmu1/6198/UM028_0054.1
MTMQLQFKILQDFICVHPSHAGLSCWMPLKLTKVEGIQGTKIFLAHGTRDQLVQSGLGRAAADVLLASARKVQFHDYDMAHCTSPAEIQDMLGFIKRVLP